MAAQPIYQFYAELCDFEPKIWRRFEVMNNMSMARLGYVIMTLFEMQASHLFCFNVPVADNFRMCVSKHITNEINRKTIDMFQAKPELSSIRVELPNEDDDIKDDDRVMDAATTKVKNILTEEKECLTFCYDYGDGWEVKLVLEKVSTDEKFPGKELPRILAGEGYGIVEDCGGPGGLDEIVNAFELKTGEQYQEYCEWLGLKEFDVTTFDMDDMNFRLKKVPRIYADAYEYGLEPTQRLLDILMRKYMKNK